MENHNIISSLVYDNNEAMSRPRERSNTWPTANIFTSSMCCDAADDDSYLFLDKALDLIDESNENATCQLSCREVQVETSRRPVKKPSSTACNKWSSTSGHHASYVELITTAISSHPDRRMTLSEIYDWLSDNVPVFEQQRHLHSSTGWKNSVRHNLSLHNRFKRVKRNGMDKPSWWTLNDDDVCRDADKTSVHQPRSISARIAASGRRFSDARSKNRRTSLPLADINRQKRRSTLPSIRPKPVEKNNERSPGSPWTSSASTVYSESSDSALPSSKSSSDQSSPGPLHQFVRSISMTLKEHENCQDRTATSRTPTVILRRPQITLCVEMATPGPSTSDVFLRAANQFVLEAYLRPSSAHESSQILRVTTPNSGVRDVAVPAPIPIKVVVHCDKQSQTEFSTNLHANEMASLPDDLATLNVEGDVGCNIMDILQFEMSCENEKR